ncbi:hypothetical protein DOY81_006321 [Sarcophaga bullata]|nr:hypothetical protein DOY81_006321 [Sarcophaga bullata]
MFLRFKEFYTIKTVMEITISVATTTTIIERILKETTSLL